ncbi:MAG TPA: DUF4147 domain-containing protein [Terriglobales bacterium]|nr:DUF4147 domain-containing protein [Terriglobales bacterium]
MPAGVNSLREIARHIFTTALAEASIARAFERHVHYERGVLRVVDDLYDIPSPADALVVAFGKAAHTMAAELGARMGSGLRGVISAPPGPGPRLAGFQYFRGGHPAPNRDSMEAAQAMLRELRAQARRRGPVIFLISGGGSSLVEKPLDSSISLEDLKACYQALVNCGAPIAEINAVRKHLSSVKGGRMAQAAAGTQQVSIMVSDVPDNALDALASGPTMPDSSTVEQCFEIAARYGLGPQVPASLRSAFEQRSLVETPKAGDPAFARSRWWPVLSNKNALEAAAAAAAAAGFAVEVDNSCDDWDYARAADYLLERLRKLRQGVSRVCLLSGGEVTVRLRNGGAGGRNQQFALYCATRIAGEKIAVLSAGTDGIDGNSPAAGAIADGTTLERAREAGFDASRSLASFDAFPLFQKTGDAIVTGPSGNNVRDLRVLLAE